MSLVNADTTWLVQLPIPSSEPDNRHWLNILIDPWLFGPQSDVASWFSKQWHAIPPALASIKDVEDLCTRVESLTADNGSSDKDINPSATKPPLSSSSPTTSNPIDTVVLSHEFTDHTHKPTLLQLPRLTRVYATTKAASLVKSWDYFDSVVEVPVLKDASKWRDQTANLTPLAGTAPPADKEQWVGVGRLMKSGDAFYYHSALSITFDVGGSNGTEAIVYTPHGVKPDVLDPLHTPPSSADKPRIRVLALLHGLHDVSLDWGQQLNLGAFNALSAQRVVGSKYWIGTHDEVKKGGGVVALFLRRKVYTVREALAKEAEGKDEKARGEDEKNGWLGWSRRPETQGGGDDLASLEKGGVDVGGNGRYFELRSGESVPLI